MIIHPLALSWQHGTVIDRLQDSVILFSLMVCFITFIVSDMGM